MKKARYTADMILIKKVNGVPNVILIERKNFPFGYAIAGGFRDVLDEHNDHPAVINNTLPIPPALDNDSILEDSKDAAIREIKEETGCDCYNVSFLCRRDDFRRDPRGYTISDIYYGSTDDMPVAADDAKSIVMIPVSDLDVFIKSNLIAFDHADILVDFLNKEGA